MRLAIAPGDCYKRENYRSIIIICFVSWESSGGWHARRHQRERPKCCCGAAGAAVLASMRARFSAMLALRQTTRRRQSMLSGVNYTAAKGLAMALVIVVLGTAGGFAGPNNRKPVVVVHPRPAPYVPISPYAPLSLLALESLLALFDLRPSQWRQAVVPLAERALRQPTSRAELSRAAQLCLWWSVKEGDDALRHRRLRHD